ncbi:MAG: glycosyltransferase family 9 protein [Desulfamplus sp.]|nr:glycosyltransferase family 9 protein [Desulfamplus sp.]
MAHGLHTFLKDHPMIDRLWIIKKDQWKKPAYFKETLQEISELALGMRRERYDLAVDLSGLLRSGLMAMASGAAVKLGFEESDEGSPLFYTHKIKGGMDIHAVDRYLKLARTLGCHTWETKYPLAPYDPAPGICSGLPSRYVVISPSAGKPANQWPAEKFGELASMLPIKSVVISSPSDKPVAEKVAHHSGGRAISIGGRTSLKELIPVIQGASCMVTNDTGPMHLAAALDVPVYAIFGPANPVRTGPRGNIHKVIQKNMDCRPCYAWKPCSHWRCMNDITVQDVLDVMPDFKNFI